jgi:hypothetical protein
MACTDRLRLRLLQAADAAPLREVAGPGLVDAAGTQAERHDVDVYSSIRPPNPASVRVLGKVGMRLVDSYVYEDGRRDVYRR